jgi:hypothetical protein
MHLLPGKTHLETFGKSLDENFIMIHDESTS